MLPADARDVADVGAGTGKLTSGLVAEGRVITAIDPDPQMLARLSERLPGIPTLVGTGRTCRCRTRRWMRWCSARRGTGSTRRARRPRSRGCCGRAGRWG